jgi:hypothetical protein
MLVGLQQWLVARENWAPDMSFGLEIYHTNGAVAFSSNDVTWNQVDFFYVGPDGSESRYLPALSGRQVLTVQMFINPPPNDRKATAHTVTVSGLTVSASGGSEAAYILVLMK